MTQTRPSSLASLADILKDPPRNHASLVDMMGIVVDVMSPTQTRTNDYMLTFTIQDPELSSISPRTTGIKVRLFVSHADDLPQIKSVGDVVLLRQCKVTSWRGDPVVTNLKGRSTIAVFLNENIPDDAFKQAYAAGKELECICLPATSRRPTTAEQMYAIALKKEFKPKAAAASISAGFGPRPALRKGPPQQNKDKFRQIQQVALGTFNDLIVEVIKKFHTREGYVELYVTDYTTNDQLFDYPSPGEKEDGDGLGSCGDVYGYASFMPVNQRDWPGPYGQRVLMVELLGPNATFADQRVNEGDVVLLQNVRIKMSRANKMEGNIFPDRVYPDKISVHILLNKEHGEAKHLMIRRQAYWESVERSTVQSKKSKKKNKKKLKEKASGAVEKLSAPASDTSSPENKYVRCSQQDVKISSLASMVDLDRTYKGPSGQVQTLPFVNHNRRARVRVVDFFPSALEAFARPIEHVTGASEDEMDMDMIDDIPSQKWEWDFFLLLEDARKPRRDSLRPPTQVWAHVDHEDAQFLLAFDDDATDLYHNSQTLAKLREKLAILWGNLEERKSAAKQNNQPYPPQVQDSAGGAAEGVQLSNLPFECCIREYGQPLDDDDVDPEDPTGILRLYSIFGTRIFET